MTTARSRASSRRWTAALGFLALAACVEKAGVSDGDVGSGDADVPIADVPLADVPVPDAPDADVPDAPAPDAPQDPCAAPGVCGDNADCLPLGGDSFRCDCRSGYSRTAPSGACTACALDDRCGIDCTACPVEQYCQGNDRPASQSCAQPSWIKPNVRPSPPGQPTMPAQSPPGFDPLGVYDEATDTVIVIPSASGTTPAQIHLLRRASGVDATCTPLPPSDAPYWEQLNAGGEVPPASENHRLAIAHLGPGDTRLVLSGGRLRSDGTTSDQVHVLSNPSNTAGLGVPTWVQVTDLPSARQLHLMTTSTRTGDVQAIVYGGTETNSAGAYLADTHFGVLRKGQPWTQIVSSTNLGGHIYGHMTYDPARDVALFFSGAVADGVLDDRLWLLRNASEPGQAQWSSLVVTPAPDLRALHGSTFLKGCGALAIFGGTNAGGQALPGLWLLTHASAGPTAMRTWIEATPPNGPIMLEGSRYPTLGWSTRCRRLVLLQGGNQDGTVRESNSELWVATGLCAYARR